MNKLILPDLFIYNRNPQEAQEIYNSVFVRKDYEVVTKNKSPFIIDCGAHIGITTIYFKKKYPDAKITSIEANPYTFKYLKKNIEANKLNNVNPVWGALTKSSKKRIPLYIDPVNKNPWSWDDSTIKDIWIDRPSRKFKKTIQVPAIHLSKFITRKIDILKMDIEGSECEVIEEIEKKLHLVDLILMEFHPSPKIPKNNLLKIINILEKNNFKTREYSLDWAIFILAKKIKN